MKPLYKIFSLLLITVVLAACSSVKITTDYDKTIDFTQFKTFEYYGWADESDKILNPLEKERIERSFGDELRARGLEYVESDGDLMVALYIMTQEKTQYNATTTGMGYSGYYGHGPGWGWGSGYRVGMATTTVSEYNYTVGTLVIDMFDAENERLIFESIATGTVDENPQNREKNIPKTVARIMAPYPVQPIIEN